MVNDFWKPVFVESMKGILLAGLPVISGSENGVSTSIVPQRPNDTQIDWGGIFGKVPQGGLPQWVASQSSATNSLHRFSYASVSGGRADATVA